MWGWWVVGDGATVEMCSVNDHLARMDYAATCILSNTTVLFHVGRVFSFFRFVRL